MVKIKNENDFYFFSVNRKTRLSTYALLILLSISALSGCGIYKTKGGSALPEVSGGLQNDSIGYADVASGVFTPSCITCHNSGNANGGIALDSYASVTTNINLIESVITSHQMPLRPTPPLTNDQITLLSNWISEGMPLVASAPASSSPTPSLSPSGSPTPIPSNTPSPAVEAAIQTIKGNFLAYVKPLVQKGCMDCHDPSAVPEGIGQLPIINGIEWKHIKEGSRALDFTAEFPNWSAKSSDPLYYLTQINGVIVNDTMPPADFRPFHELDGKLLNSAEKTIILDWVQNSEQLLAAASAPPTARQFLTTNCSGCHNTDISSGGFILWSGASVMGIPEVTPFNPDNSALYLVLLPDSSLRHGLPQMPLGGSATADEQKLISDWITAGAP